MRVATLGVDCAEIWNLELPPVDLLVLPELALTPWLCATRDVDPVALTRLLTERFQLEPRAVKTIVEAAQAASQK